MTQCIITVNISYSYSDIHNITVKESFVNMIDVRSAFAALVTHGYRQVKKSGL